MSVVIVSGGLDSVTLLHEVVRNQGKTNVLSFLYGQKHSKEIACASWHAGQLGCTHKIIDVRQELALALSSSALVAEGVEIPHIDDVMGDPQPVTYVPNRNMIFLSIAAAYAESIGSNFVYYGAQKHDQYGYWDTTPQFLNALNNVFKLNRKTPICILAPFVTFSKAQTLKVGLELGVDYGKTWSCYAGRNKACGTCPTCSERLTAFAELGVKDPLEYE